jgi:hypothetical protein
MGGDPFWGTKETPVAPVKSEPWMVTDFVPEAGPELGETELTASFNARVAVVVPEVPLESDPVPFHDFPSCEIVTFKVEL